MTWINFDTFSIPFTNISSERGLVAIGDAGVWADLQQNIFKIRSNSGSGGYVGFMCPDIGYKPNIDPSHFFHECIKPKFSPKLKKIRITANTAESQPSASLTIQTENSNFEITNSINVNITDTESIYTLELTNFSKFNKIVCITPYGSGAKIDIKKIEIEIEEVVYEDIFQKTLVISINQLVRMYSDINGLVKNLGWIAHNDFRVPAMGGGLALSLMVGVHLGIVSEFLAKKISYNSITAFINSPKYNNLIAHFTNTTGILDWSEYSTVDTTLGIVSSLIASHYFGFTDLYNTLITLCKNIKFDNLVINKYISHGYDSTNNLLTSSWDWWGGEESIINVLFFFSNTRKEVSPINHSVNVYNGTGFILELIALFFKEFGHENNKIDRWGVNWKTRRQELLTQHIQNGTPNIFGSSASEILIYDISNNPSTTYNVVGSQNPSSSNGVWISPHYAIMASSLSPSASNNGFEYAIEPVQVLESVRVSGLNSEQIITKHVAWSSLNCFFNSIGAYNSYAKYNNKSNIIFSESSLIFENAILKLFSSNKRISK